MIAYGAPSIRKGPDLGAAEPTAPQYSWADADLRRRRPGATAEPYFAGSVAANSGFVLLQRTGNDGPGQASSNG
jgi:hypothetical protein